MINIDYKEHGVDAVMGCIETVRATGDSEFIEYCGDGSLEMFGEDDQGRETSGDVSVYSIIDSAGDAIADLLVQLDAERDRADASAAHVDRLHLALTSGSEPESGYVMAYAIATQDQPETNLAGLKARVAAETLDRIAVLLGAGATLKEITEHVADEIAAGGGHE